MFISKAIKFEDSSYHSLGQDKLSFWPQESPKKLSSYSQRASWNNKDALGKYCFRVSHPISCWEMVQHGKEVFSKDGIHGQAVIVSTRSANHFRRHSSAQYSMQYGVGSEPLFCLLALTQFARPSRPGNQILLSRSRVYGSGEPEAGGIKRAFSGCKPHPG